MSQANGNWALKRGVAVYIGKSFGPVSDPGKRERFDRQVPVLGWTGAIARRVFTEVYCECRSRLRAEGCNFGIIVKVERKGRKDTPIAPHYYFPKKPVFYVERIQG